MTREDIFRLEKDIELKAYQNILKMSENNEPIVIKVKKNSDNYYRLRKWKKGNFPLTITRSHTFQTLGLELDIEYKYILVD
ncbi:MAG TPA: hypothetical protein VLB84_20020 [Bacteroidia bacterium]|nr:hypothetical protein [Bacteroidia bacterium]